MPKSDPQADWVFKKSSPLTFTGYLVENTGDGPDTSYVVYYWVPSHVYTGDGPNTAYTGDFRVSGVTGKGKG